MPESLSKEEHTQEHIRLHKSLDELVADWITNNPGKLPSNSSVLELMHWSYTETKNPTERNT